MLTSILFIFIAALVSRPMYSPPITTAFPFFFALVASTSLSTSSISLKKKMFLESAPCTPKSVNLITCREKNYVGLEEWRLTFMFVDNPQRNTTYRGTSCNQQWYLKASPAALMRVLEARSAFTISVLRINAIPTNKLSINEKFSFKPVFVERQDHKEIFSTGNGDAINSLISNITSSLVEYHLSLHTTREAVSLLHFQHRHETLEVVQVLQKHLHCDVFHKEGKKHSTCRLTRITNNFSPSFGSKQPHLS